MDWSRLREGCSSAVLTTLTPCCAKKICSDICTATLFVASWWTNSAASAAALNLPFLHGPSHSAAVIELKRATATSISWKDIKTAPTGILRCVKVAEGVYYERYLRLPRCGFS